MQRQCILHVPIVKENLKKRLIKLNEEKLVKHKLPEPKPLSKIEQIRKNREAKLTEIMVLSNGKISKQLPKIMKNQVWMSSNIIENSQIQLYIRDQITKTQNFLEVIAQALVNKGVIDEIPGIKKQILKKKEDEKKNEPKKNK